MLPRTSLHLALFLALSTAACTCGPRKPINDTLKKEGEVCSSDDNCETGLCDGVVQAVCVRKCSSTCKTEEVCTQLTPGRFSCQPDQRKLCQACLIDSDCPYPADKCIVVNSERVCGRDCAFDQSCPSGYICVNGRGSDGMSKVQQCSPMVASCACLARGDLMQPCSNTSDAGVCIGVKTCDLVNNGISCNAPVPLPEACNGKDDNCDGQVDEGASVVTCGVGACRRTVNTCTDGGIAMCAPGAPITELCNNIDDDCDGNVDNGFPIDNDVNNCGGCGVVCNLPNATPTCSNRTCRVQTCNAGFANCDGLDPNGCEVETASNAMNCGGCGMSCTRPNSVATCVNSACQFVCAAGWYDLNNDPMDGCEYACTFTSATDLPDLSFVDANCDGIDGELNNGIFVSPSGSDSAVGTRAAPKQTLAAAVTAMVTGGKRDLYLAAGTYQGPLALLGISGANIAGAYHPMTWRRALSNQVLVQGGAKALEIEAANNVLVQAIRFEGGVGTPSAYGGWVKESTNVRLESLELRAGNGAQGTDGMPGMPGTPGQPGSPGGEGCANDQNLTATGVGCAIVLGRCRQPLAGTGGTSACGFPGGNGGTPTYAVGAVPGSPGSAAPNGTGSAGQGVGGSIGQGPASNAANGGTGQPGNGGANGTGATMAGVFTVSGFNGVSGTAGTSGTNGRGGGGGGGGCGDQFNFFGYTCQSFGSAGGGGGGGGCGGAGGQPGQGGGASVGLFLYNASVTAQSVVAVSGNGGRGGAGGEGGALGTGGTGGASPYDSDQGQACVGGLGGRGGDGGRGGHGGGGSGGSVYGLVKNGASTWNPISGTSFMVGTVGQGGPSMGSPGVAGVSGIQLTF